MKALRSSNVPVLVGDSSVIGFKVAGPKGPQVGEVVHDISVDESRNAPSQNLLENGRRGHSHLPEDEHDASTDLPGQILVCGDPAW
eukprot:scaffold35917_cov129-Isochrysis_galbana.AAC.2